MRFTQEEFEDTKEVIRISISKKDRQHNGQEKKMQKDNQRSTKHTHKTKDRVARTPLNTGGEHRCSGRVGNSCSTCGTRRVNLVTNPVICRERGKDWEVLTTDEILYKPLYQHMVQYNKCIQYFQRVDRCRFNQYQGQQLCYQMT